MLFNIRCASKKKQVFFLLKNLVEAITFSRGGSFFPHIMRVCVVVTTMENVYGFQNLLWRILPLGRKYTTKDTIQCVRSGKLRYFPVGRGGRRGGGVAFLPPPPRKSVISPINWGGGCPFVIG